MRESVAALENDLLVDFEQAQRARGERLRRFHAVEAPTVRALGAVLLSAMVALHNWELMPSARGASLPFAAGAIAYALVSWLVLLRAYRSPPRLPWDVLVAGSDVLFCAAAVLCTGGVESLLFLVLCVRVADQATTTFPRVLAFAHATLAVYVVVCLVQVRQHPELLGRAAVQAALLYLVNLYLVASSRSTDRLRQRSAAAYRLARELVWRLRAQRDELEDARSRAELASDAKSRFLAVISHELRTPLHGMLGMTDLLLDTGLDREQVNLAQTARASGQTLLGLINDILDFSKAEEGGIELDQETVDLREVAADALRTVAPLAASRGLLVEWSATAEVPERVLGDTARIRQILLNILGNAVKFTDSGAVVLSIDSVAERDHHVIEIVVEDTGIGVPPSQQELIFSAFNQVDTSPTRRNGGAGLGLAISRALARRMGGDLTGESRDGGGSQFRFTARLPRAPVGPSEDAQLLPSATFLVDVQLPATASFVRQLLISWGLTPVGANARTPDLVVVDAHSPLRGPITLLLAPWAGPEHQAPQHPSVVRLPLRVHELRRCLERHLCASGVRASDPGGRPIDVLVVEDNPVNQRVAQKTLERLGHRVTIAASGDEAVARATTGGFELILMDLQLPDVDGVEATRRIRSHELTRFVPIIALTADASREDRARCLGAGMNDHLSKPLRRADLERALQRWCRGARLESERRASGS
jgi:signal transduction histidine kinase/ActR/RegA family two-component response regulator